METLIINRRKYYPVNDLMKIYPTLFKGCRTSREFVSKNDIPANKYIFAREVKGNWEKSSDISTLHDKVFIRKIYFNAEYLRDHKEEDAKQYDPLPPIIKLEDHEKFFDDKGNIIDIEVVGERDQNKCYFKVRDIAKGFKHNELNKTIKRKDHNGYVEDIHYIFFILPLEKKSSKQRKELYFTYIGFLRFIFASRKKISDIFSFWATRNLFALHMGTQEQKAELVANTLGVSSQAVKNVFHKTVNLISCIYLFSIGKVKDLRKELGLDAKFNDNDFVYKWGRTNDLGGRTNDHEQTYGKLNKACIELILYCMIDKQYISEAETKIKHFFGTTDMVVDHPKYQELVVIPKNKMKIIKDMYDSTASKYMISNIELTNHIERKNHDLRLIKEKHKNELLQKDLEIGSLKNIAEKELFTKNLEIESLKKDLEIANLKLSMKCNH